MSIDVLNIFNLAKSDPNIYNLIIGKEVIHKVLGKGIVTRIEPGILNNKYIYINFGEEKQFNENVYNYLTEIKLEDYELDYINRKMSNKSEKQLKLYQLSMRLSRYISGVPITRHSNISKNDEDKKFIENFIKDRNIKEIIHFTQLDNLDSIMKNGLLSVEYLDENNIRFFRNDYNRFDNFKNAICVSISFPNYQMFYKLRGEDKSKKWVVLIIKPEVLYEKACAFCSGNAASYKVNSIDIDKRMSGKSLESLFYDFLDNDIEKTREDLNIRNSYTTNPQAEVLVFDKIETKYIKGIVFSTEDQDLLKKYTGKYKGVRVVSNNYYYSARSDYKFWGGNYGKTSSVCSE